MSDSPLVIVALSGGVDSAVAASLLLEAGHRVQCLHMTNWEDDAYCEAAADFQDARRICDRLELPLHRVNFAKEYAEQVFAHFLNEHRAGRTPNPDVACNREIKFGTLLRYAQRLGADLLATGHYARLTRAGAQTQLLKGRDAGKDQSYFLHAVDGRALERVMFPLGALEKSEVRAIARSRRLPVAEKKDSTGICFIGERPFVEFLGRYLPADPGPIVDKDGQRVGTHRGLAFYTLGQRHGLKIGGVKSGGDAPWYVAKKRPDRNELVVVQGREDPLLLQNRLRASRAHWINEPPPGWGSGASFRCRAKTRYRQPDQPCTVVPIGGDGYEVSFDSPQRAVTPGQYVVLYDGERCLGGATIESAELRTAERRTLGQGSDNASAARALKA